MNDEKNNKASSTFVSRAGIKLEHALNVFGIDPAGKTCADLGCNAGGFTDCLLQRGATKVYAIDTGYGALEWKLRRDPRVVVMERTNAIHVSLPERVDIVTIDVAWTRQRIILPAALRLIAAGADIITLIKPHYEAAPNQLRKGILAPEHLSSVVQAVLADARSAGFEIVQTTQSPITGGKGNIEMLAHLRLATRDL